MKKVIIALFLFTVSFLLFADAAPIVLDPSYEHDKWITLPKDMLNRTGGKPSKRDIAGSINRKKLIYILSGEGV